MLSKTTSSPARSAARGALPESITGLVGNGSRSEPDHGRAAGAAPAGETRIARFRRKALRGRLHGYAILAVALGAFLIALAASNTAHVKVSWVFGTSHVSLVWLVLFTAILGWLLGLISSARFRWRTRAPRSGGAAS